MAPGGHAPGLQWLFHAWAVKPLKPGFDGETDTLQGPTTTSHQL